MGICDQKTELVNKTGQLIGFDVEHGICPLRDLPAGKSRSVSLSLIRKRCREHGSPDWPIRVLINGRFHGMQLHPRHHILMMTRIVFRYRLSPDGTCVLIAEGVVENFVDRVFGCFINWDKRIYNEIAEADSTRRSARSFQDPHGVGPSVRDVNCLPLREDVDNDTVEVPLIDNSPRLLSSFVLRSASWRKTIINAIPSQKGRMVRLWYGGGGRTRAALASVLNSSGKNWNAATVESRKRFSRMLSLRRRDEFHRLLLFAFAFLLVATLHLLRMWKNSL